MGAPSMKKVVKKAAKSDDKTMTMGSLAKLLAEKNGLEPKQIKRIFADLADVASEEVERVNKFTVPNLCTIKARVKPARKAGVTTLFGKKTKVKAKPATTVIKAAPVPSLKKLFC